MDPIIFTRDDLMFGSTGPTGPAPHLRAGKSVSYSEMVKSCPPKTRVLVLYTGGTIGMSHDEEGKLVAKTGTIREYMKNYYEYVCDRDDQIFGEEYNDEGEGLFLCRSLKSTFQLLEYKSLLDSSCMTPSGWNQMMKTVYDMYKDFDSFVILHGTDTMAFTSSALSFGFRNLSKLVILTGSQIPLSEKGRNDGIDNLLSSLWIAGNRIYSKLIPEVTLCFNRKLFRGCRASKISANRFDAFGSPNYPVLMRLGVGAKVRWNCVQPIPKESEKFEFLPYYVPKKDEKEFAILHLYPGIRKQVENMIHGDDYFGVVVLSFGTGNYSDVIGEMFNELKKKNVILVNITQCSSGKVECIYAASGKSTVSGGDMTTEATYCKMIHLFSHTRSYQMDEKKYKFMEEFLQKNLRGELSEINWNAYNAMHYRGHLEERRNDEIIQF